MGPFDIFDTIDRLRRGGAPFCVATVVRTADVTSAKAGAKAAVTEAGELLGHLGGGCVRSAVLRAAAQAMAQGQARLIRIKPGARVTALQDSDGAHLYKSGCPSGGTVDVLIEPYALPPQLVILGVTPISRALAAHGACAGYRVVTPAPMDFAGATRSFDDIDPGLITADDFVVVASQGAADLASLRVALHSPARRVSMVASRRKAEALTARLVAEGMAPDRVGRLKSPAGLDLGGIDPHEIALSILAEIVRWRNTDRLGQDNDHAETA